MTNTDDEVRGPGEPSAPDAAAGTPTDTRRVLAVVILPLFMALMAISVVNVALPVIGSAFGTDSHGLQWVVAGYALAFGLFLVPAGRLGDATGRKRIFVLGIVIFTAGAVLAALAGSIEMLNIGRMVQGIGAGFVNPQSFGLVQLHFRGAARARAFATMATVVALATALGPLVGGLLIQVFGDDLGWRVMFGVNVPLGVVALLCALRWLPDDRHARPSETTTRRRLDLDPVGIVLLGAAVASIMLPFLSGASSAAMWLLVPVGLALIGTFTRWEHRYQRRGRPPLVNPGIFTDKGFRNGMLIVSIWFMGGTSLWIVIPLYLQFHLGHTPLESALISLPASVFGAVAAQIAGRYVLAWGRRMVIAGLATQLTALASMIALLGAVESGALGYLILMVPAALAGAAQGMTISPNQTLTLQAVDPAYGSVAASVISLGQRMGTAVGTAAVPAALFAVAHTADDWLLAVRTSVGIIAALSLAALALSVVDRVRERREAEGVR